MNVSQWLKHLADRGYAPADELTATQIGNAVGCQSQNVRLWWARGLRHAAKTRTEMSSDPGPLRRKVSTAQDVAQFMADRDAAAGTPSTLTTGHGPTPFSTPAGLGLAKAAPAGSNSAPAGLGLAKTAPTGTVFNDAEFEPDTSMGYGRGPRLSEQAPAESLQRKRGRPAGSKTKSSRATKSSPSRSKPAKSTPTKAR